MLALSLMSLHAQAQVFNYDVNNDGDVNVLDVTILVDKILGEDQPARLPLIFHADQKPFENPNGPSNARRKTQETTIMTLEEFFVNYTYERSGFPGLYMFSIPELKTFWQKEEGFWLIGNDGQPGNGYWPSNTDENSDVTFYAYANVGLTNTNHDNNAMFFCEGNDDNRTGDVSKPYIHFKLDEDGPATKDLLVARQKDNWNHCKGHIFFHFEHACAALQFFLVKTQKLAGYDVKVKKAILYNVKNDGNYFFNSNLTQRGYWEGVKHTYDTNRTYYTLWDGEDYQVVPIIPEDPNDTSEMWQLTSSTNPESDYFFFIPQEFPNWKITTPITADTTGAYIELECQINPTDNTQGGFKGKVYIPFSTASLTNGLQMGYSYPIIVRLGTAMVNSQGNKLFGTDGKLKVFE